MERGNAGQLAPGFSAGYKDKLNSVNDLELSNITMPSTQNSVTVQSGKEGDPSIVKTLLADLQKEGSNSDEPRSKVGKDGTDVATSVVAAITSANADVVGDNGLIITAGAAGTDGDVLDHI